ncbi:hypothetical protein [Microvirga lenta]|nr:hypothetical protein [Microvirga lenta]
MRRVLAAFLAACGLTAPVGAQADIILDKVVIFSRPGHARGPH